MNEKIYNALKQNNGTITTAQVIAMGFSRAILSEYVKKGLLERTRHGLYVMKDAISDDMYNLMLRSEKIIFSHETALFLNGLSERTPFVHSVTIPSNSSLSATTKEDCVCYYIAAKLHGLGATVKRTTMGNEVRCYNLERTICDILRSRNRLDEETVISAIKNYVASNEKDLNLLSLYAKEFRVQAVLKKYLEVLL